MLTHCGLSRGLRRSAERVGPAAYPGAPLRSAPRLPYSRPLRGFRRSPPDVEADAPPEHPYGLIWREAGRKYRNYQSYRTNRRGGGSPRRGAGHVLSPVRSGSSRRGRVSVHAAAAPAETGGIVAHIRSPRAPAGARRRRSSRGACVGRPERIGAIVIFGWNRRFAYFRKKR